MTGNCFPSAGWHRYGGIAAWKKAGVSVARPGCNLFGSG